MPQLNATISSGLWRALLDYAEKTQEPLAHIVSKALADYLQVTHHTLYQVSTATALVEGIYQGAVRVGTLREQFLDFVRLQRASLLCLRDLHLVDNLHW